MLHLIITIISGWIYQSLKLFSYSNTVAIVAFEDANVLASPQIRPIESSNYSYPTFHK